VDERRDPQHFLEFFEQRGHRVVPSASLVPARTTPRSLLTTGGHAALQAGLPRPRGAPAKRVADVQRCFRTTDIEEVGNTRRHLTFFEMLGNWSFGDYFKEQSIPWGWELSTRDSGSIPSGSG
jgi:alanyl-tRNA synthetase